MTVTFERLGRWFLAGAALCLVALPVALPVLEDTARFATALTFAVLGGNLLVQGVVWIVLQRRWFGSPAALERTARRGIPTAAQVVTVTSTSSAIGTEPLPVLDLDVGGRRVRRRVRVPFAHVAAVRPGAVLPVRVDPEGTPAIVVEWTKVP
ncbi:hypothetical protein Acsp06_14500 [Actinomycetospora sp. NBRC 106375]|uniref:hypothetical protein n=1 Tax=Actinomycetospora sp. NBRC 106375 TaxID=3032207 RepID=UPI0024A55B41|nr:hypothetical protein [Actinomycetospora sp. NBRC 106375]GLZ45265.1 hypothetical protein Acsp06_14500 [Actinomycetospora sp. NBRC 106375]